MNTSLKSSLKSYDKDVDTRSLYHTTIDIFLTRDPGDVSCLLQLVPVTRIEKMTERTGVQT